MLFRMQTMLCRSSSLSLSLFCCCLLHFLCSILHLLIVVVVVLLQTWIKHWYNLTLMNLIEGVDFYWKCKVHDHKIWEHMYSMCLQVCRYDFSVSVRVATAVCSVSKHKWSLNHTCVYIWMFIRIQIKIYIHIYTYIHKYIYSYITTHTHAHTHMHINTKLSSSYTRRQLCAEF